MQIIIITEFNCINVYNILLLWKYVKYIVYVVLIIFYRWKLSGRVCKRKSNRGLSLHILRFYIYRSPPRAVVKILSQRSYGGTNFAQRPPTRLSVAPTHSEKELLLSPSIGKLHSHRVYNKGTYYITQCQYIVLYTMYYYYMTYAPARGHM